MSAETSTTEIAEPQQSLLPDAEAAGWVLNSSLASIFEDTTADAAPMPRRPAPEPPQSGVQSYDFRSPLLIPPGKMQRVMAHQEEFARDMAARLCAHLHADFSLQLAGIQTLAYQKLSQDWRGPRHLSLFKMDPLRGVSVLEISHHLGLCMVDRLMGGSGRVESSDAEISEVEKVLLEQSVQLFLGQWCGHWDATRDLKPTLLGYENFGGFIRTIPAETIMLAVTFQVQFAECEGQIQIAAPYAAMEPLLGRVCQGHENSPSTHATPAASAAPVRWNSCFNDVPVPVTAEWDGLEMTARQILALKVGDVLPLTGRAQLVNVRVAEMLRFQGRPGTQSGNWAVQLTRVINP